MIRGFLSGVFWGSLIAALGLGTVSQLSSPPVARIEAEVSTAARAKPADAPATAVADSVPEPTEEGAPPPETAAGDALVKPADALSADPVATGTTATDPAPTDEAPAKPVTTAVEALAPPAGSEFAKPLPDLDPVAPTREDGAAPAVVDAGALVAPASEAATATDGTAAAPETGLDAPKPLVAAQEGPEAASLPKAESPVEDEKIALLVPGQLPLPQSDTAPTLAENPAPPAKAEPEEVLLKPLPEVLPVPETQPTTKPPEQLLPDPALVQDDDPAVEPEAADTLAPTPALTGTVDGVTIGRLPRIGDPAPATEPNPEDLPEAVPGVVPEVVPEVVIDGEQDLPPLQKYAGEFENLDAKPLFAIILIDTGGADLDRAALAAMPFPVTFALDPLAPNVAEASKIYRDAGKEVIMVATGIPPGATAADLEVTFQAHAATLPEAVAVIDTEFGAFQADRPLATQVIPILKAQGRGLISWDRGLNAADQVARRDGLPAGMVFRKLDGKGENKSAVRRALDRAAFKAAQDGRVMVIGQTLPETVAAVMEWTVEGRAASVALAPVSASLTTQ